MGSSKQGRNTLLKGGLLGASHDPHHHKTSLKIKIDRKKLHDHEEDMEIIEQLKKTHQLMKMDKNWMVRKLKMMMKFTTQDEHTKNLAKTLITDRND